MSRNPDYWVKSKAYPVEIFTREEWIENKERLRIYIERKHGMKKRKAEKAIGSGIIKCGTCGAKFFHQVQIRKRRNKEQQYRYYFHHATIAGACSQVPKSITQNRTNALFEIFMLYNTVTSDGGSKFLKERLFQEEIERKAIKEKLKVLKNNRKATEIQVKKFKKALESREDVGSITVLAKQTDSGSNININIA